MFRRIDVWKQTEGKFEGKYLCRTCRKTTSKPKERERSYLRDFRKRPDYVPDDFNTNNKGRISDEEFEKLIEEFEQGNWSGARSYAEYKKHEDYINFLFRVEFQRRRGVYSESRQREEPQTKPQTSYYQILEVRQDASFEEIKDSYKKLVIKWHPDKNKDDPVLAESMFKKIREAYETLKDPEKKKKYDQAIS